MTDLTLRAALLVSAGAVMGALARWGIASALPRGFPWGILVVNVVGSFFIALLAFGPLARGALGHEARLFLAVGLLGSFTTMSAFAHDTIALLDAGEHGRAALNALANPILCLAAAWLGRVVALAWP